MCGPRGRGGDGPPLRARGGAAVDDVPTTRGRRPKRVRYWRLRVVDGSLGYAHEVDEARWVSAAEAESLLTYERDLDVLHALVGPAPHD